MDEARGAAMCKMYNDERIGRENGCWWSRGPREVPETSEESVSVWGGTEERLDRWVRAMR